MQYLHGAVESSNKMQAVLSHYIAHHLSSALRKTGFQSPSCVQCQVWTGSTFRHKTARDLNHPDILGGGGALIEFNTLILVSSKGVAAWRPCSRRGREGLGVERTGLGAGVSPVRVGVRGGLASSRPEQALHPPASQVPRG